MKASESAKKFKQKRNLSLEERQRRAKNMLLNRGCYKGKLEEEKKGYSVTMRVNKATFEKFKEICHQNDTRPGTYINEIIEHIVDTEELIEIIEDTDTEE